MFAKTQFRFFSKLLTTLLAGALLLLACTPAATATDVPTSTLIPVTEAPTPIPATDIPTALPPSSKGITVTYGPLTLVIPPEIASGASGNEVSPVTGDESAWWQLTPGHNQLTLDDYLLQGKLFQPQIFVYPAQSYAELLQARGGDSIQRLQTILDNPGALIDPDQLPQAPINATQIIASQIKVVDFQNGQGVRVVTQYSQGLVPINNYELIYHFEGLTNDGQYYVIAILPMTAPKLQENDTTGTTIPVGGVPMPDLNTTNPDMHGYYADVQQMLDGLQPGAFNPDLEQLDLLIQSILIIP